MCLALRPPYAGIHFLTCGFKNTQMWQPIAAPDSCEPVDYTSQIRELQSGTGVEHPDLESLRNRTVLIFGDSVDRECALPIWCDVGCD